MPPLARRDVRNLVRKLDASACPSQQNEALTTITELSNCPGDLNSLAAIAAAGAIPPLVQLLVARSSTDVQWNAAAALGNLATKNRDAIAAAGASAGVDVLEKMEHLGLGRR
ncbi:hypothetical protein FOA52_014161 [Chlamydomonas sp. UWO 241]|nr:hypothetical protein FOA52_014161 [Chlamydomonas sp. UWO 241]